MVDCCAFRSRDIQLGVDRCPSFCGTFSVSANKIDIKCGIRKCIQRPYNQAVVVIGDEVHNYLW